MAPSAVQVDPSSGPVMTLQAGSSDSKTTTTRTPQEHEEYQYINLIRDIIDNGEHRPDRTGTGTYSIFAPAPMKFNLTRASTSTCPNSSEPVPVLPLLTTKRVFLRAVIAELLWFIAGDTYSKTLSEKGVKIWDGNGSREFLDKAGLSHRAEGDLGPVYGFQWRHFGATYQDHQTDYIGQGVDQLAEVVRKLKHAPFDRRIILSAWNPADLGKMALPPCHMFAQFYVSFTSKQRVRRGARQPQQQEEEKEQDRGHNERTGGNERGVLHAQLYQRSCDMGLGIPFNIASYALLTHMLAYVCDLTPGTLTHVMGDAHVYIDHVDALEQQITREPRPFPELQLRPYDGEENGEDPKLRVESKRGVATVQGMEGWSVDDFVVKGYNPHGKVAMKMSV